MATATVTGAHTGGWRGGESMAGPGWEQPSLCDDLGDWLAEHRRRIDSSEAAWLEALAEFDTGRRWSDDGHLSCADWLMWRCGLGRTAAYERVRVAHELRRRPILADALATGRASYCAVRAMVKALDASPDVDEAFVRVAETGTVLDVERMVRHFLLHASQHKPPDDRLSRRGLIISPRDDGTCKLHAILTAAEAAELETALRAHTAPRATQPVHESARADGTTDGRDDGTVGEEEPVDEYARADDAGPSDPPDWPTVRADALMSLARAGLAGGHSPGADRYLTHIVVEHGHGCLLGGEPVPDRDLHQILCDCSTVTHHVDPDGTPLALGRKTRTWTTAQRRAITVRDGGRCRWPGCQHTHTDVHHVAAWDIGGRTDIDNGIALCPKHHTAIHHGFHVTGSANHTLTFHRPNGMVLGTSGVDHLGRQPPLGHGTYHDERCQRDCGPGLAPGQASGEACAVASSAS